MSTNTNVAFLDGIALFEVSLVVVLAGGRVIASTSIAVRLIRFVALDVVVTD